MLPSLILYILPVGWGNPDPGSHSDRSWPPAWHNQRLPGGFEGNSIERVEAAPHHWQSWRAGSCMWDPQPLAAQPIHWHRCHRVHLEDCLDVQQHAIGMRTTEAKTTWQQFLSLRHTLKQNTRQREHSMEEGIWTQVMSAADPAGKDHPLPEANPNPFLHSWTCSHNLVAAGGYSTC